MLHAICRTCLTSQNEGLSFRSQVVWHRFLLPKSRRRFDFRCLCASLVLSDGHQKWSGVLDSGTKDLQCIPHCQVHCIRQIQPWDDFATGIGQTPITWGFRGNSSGCLVKHIKTSTYNVSMSLLASAQIKKKHKTPTVWGEWRHVGLLEDKQCNRKHIMYIYIYISNYHIYS